MVIWTLMGYNHEGISVVELVFTGYMLLTLWRHMTSGGSGLFRRNVPMLYHRQITLFDLIGARQLLEFIGVSTALVFIWAVLHAVGMLQDFRRPDLLVAGWLMMAWIGTATGALFAVITEISETADRFIQPMQYLNIPISGAFFMVDWLPPWAQRLIMYHPLVHCWEMFREGYFGETMVAHYDIPYFLACAFTMSFVGVVLVNMVRTRLQLA
jgi:capsular polysaccharide transport system permease protein